MIDQLLFFNHFVIIAIKIINYCFKFKRALSHSNGRRGVDQLLVVGNGDHRDIISMTVICLYKGTLVRENLVGGNLECTKKILLKSI